MHQRHNRGFSGDFQRNTLKRRASTGNGLLVNDSLLTGVPLTIGLIDLALQAVFRAQWRGANGPSRPRRNMELT